MHQIERVLEIEITERIFLIDAKPEVKCPIKFHRYAYAELMKENPTFLFIELTLISKGYFSYV